MKILSDIVWKIPVESVTGDLNIPILAVSFDSRRAEPGTLFVAMRGTVSDGHDFIPDVIRKGVSAIVCEELPGSIRHDITYIVARDTAQALGLICSEFYGRPSHKLTLVGITGTNGKTTVATLLYELFRKLGYKAGLISTVACYVDGERSEATHTTPDAVQLNALLARMVQAGCSHCFMEVSSHAIVQQRIAGLLFAGGVFTNLTHDHLDFHGTFASYRDAKKRFFDGLPSSAFALVNKDDRNGLIMVQNTKARVATSAMKSVADFTCRVVEHDMVGMQLHIGGHEAWMQFVGGFNACNLLQVFAVASLLGETAPEVLQAMSTLKAVDGRFEVIRSPGGVTAIVDYAHTPDALANVLQAIKLIAPKSGGSIITVAGCGGDRDRSKRPEMARIAAEHSSRAIFTSDNPRSEDPSDIIAEMQTGLDGEQRRHVLVIPDRREAIRTACLMAQPSDIVLVAGKGHETYQIAKGVKTHFDDREVICEIFGIETDK